MKKIKLRTFAFILTVLVILNSVIPALAYKPDTAEMTLMLTDLEPTSEYYDSEIATPGNTAPPEQEPPADESDTEALPPLQTSVGIMPLAAAGTLGSQAIGTTVKINVNNATREFIIVQHGRPSSIYDNGWNDATVLLMKDIYEKGLWDPSWDTNNYENSSIHSYLNNQFLNLLDANIKNAVLTLKLPYRPGSSGASVATGGSGLPSKIFLLSAFEVGFATLTYPPDVADGAKLTYFDGGDGAAAKNKRIGYLNGTAEIWWLRTPSSTASGLWGVNHDGNIAGVGTSGSFPYGIRPALALPSAVYVDANGNISVDTTPTAPSSITVPVSIKYNTAYTISWGAAASSSGTLAGYRLERQINGGSWTQIYQGTATSYSQTLTRDQANTVNYRVKAYSTGGLESGYTTGTARTVTNNMAPTAPSNLSSDILLVNSWENTTVAYTWTASTDADSDSITYYIEESVNGGSWVQVATTSGTSYTHTIDSADNTIQIRVRAYDSRDYSGYGTSATTSIIHDTSSPTLNLVAAPDPGSGWTASDVIITVVMANALSPLDKLVTSTGTINITGNTATQTFTADSVGTYTFTVYNKAGLSSTESITVGNVDQEPPVIAYTTSVPDGGFTNQDVDISFTLSDALSGLQRFVTPTGPAELSGNTAAYTYTVTQNGAPTFTLLDNVFNSTSVNIIINMIDRVKPAASINAALKRWHNQSDTVLQIGADDDYSGVAHIRLPDGSLFYGDSTDFAIMENGTYTVTATDRAGNVSGEASFNYYWFDRTPPTITSLRFEETNTGLIARALSLLSKDIVTNKQIKMIISHDDTPVRNEAESGVEWILYRVYDSEGNPKDDWIATRVNDSVPNIDYEVNGYVEVQVVDRAGNYSSIQRYGILLDSTPPTVTYTLSETGVTNRPVIVTLNGEDEPDGSGFKGFILPEGNVLVPQSEIEYTFTENGSRTFTGCDNAGNQTPVTVTVSNIKSAPPVVEDILIEKTGNALTRSLSGFFGLAYNERVKVTIVATDAGPVTIYYCVTPGADIPEDAVWHEAPDGIIYFDTEMTGVIHAKALDVASNWSNTMSRALVLDGTPPVLAITFEPRENDFEPVVIKVLAEDDSTVAGISGVAGITLPTGEFVARDYIEYTVKENGIFVFKAVDNAGNETVETVDIDYIRPVLPDDWESSAPVIDAVLHAVGKHYIGDVDYGDLLKLRNIDLSAKGLENLPDILGYARNITRLDLRGNELAQIPECVFKLENLEYLDVSNNNLQSADDRIANLKVLNYLDVSLNYLVDYECPAIISNYRNVGNFTYTGNPDHYSFEFVEHDYGKEYVGNTVQADVLWSFGGEALESTLEHHRKSLYQKYYNDYKTYRPLIYDYSVTTGEIQNNTPDYARVYLPESGIMKIGMALGAGNGILPAIMPMNMSFASIGSNSESVEILDIPAPDIKSIDVARGVVVVDASIVDENIRADLKAVVEVSDEDGNILAMSEAKVPENKLCEVPVALILRKGHIITARLVNNEFSSNHASDVNQQNGGAASGGANGGSGGGGSVRTEYVVIEKVVEKEVVLEVEKIGGSVAENYEPPNASDSVSSSEKDTDAHNMLENGRGSANDDGNPNSGMNTDNTVATDSGTEDSTEIEAVGSGGIVGMFKKLIGWLTEYRVALLFLFPLFIVTVLCLIWFAWNRKKTPLNNLVLYDFSNIVNVSDTTREDFCWQIGIHDDAARMEKLFTGIWSDTLVYRVIYRTNLNEDYCVWEDDLPSTETHEFDVSTLKLAASEYVTDIKLEFGTVPPGFREVDAPYILARVPEGTHHKNRLSTKLMWAASAAKSSCATRTSG